MTFYDSTLDFCSSYFILCPLPSIYPVFYQQSNEVGGSYYMEKEGLKRSLALLEASGVTLDCIVTDRHLQIQKYLREKGITQYYDVWHIDRGMTY